MLTNMTPGEIAFLDYCENNGIISEKIPEDNINKTPDFKVYFNEKAVAVIEVKDFNDNDCEQKAIKDFNDGKMSSWGGTIGERYQQKIRDGKKQLKQYKNSELVRILLIYDNRDILTRTNDEYEISIAMYGFETRYPNHNGIKKIFGHDKMMKENEKTYISYVGILNDSGKLLLYENFYAKDKFSFPENQRILKADVFRLAQHPKKQLSGWKLLTE